MFKRLPPRSRPSVDQLDARSRAADSLVKSLNLLVRGYPPSAFSRRVRLALTRYNDAIVADKMLANMLGDAVVPIPQGTYSMKGVVISSTLIQFVEDACCPEQQVINASYAAYRRFIRASTTSRWRRATFAQWLQARTTALASMRNFNMTIQRNAADAEKCNAFEQHKRESALDREK